MKHHQDLPLGSLADLESMAKILTANSVTQSHRLISFAIFSSIYSFHLIPTAPGHWATSLGPDHTDLQQISDFTKGFSLAPHRSQSDFFERNSLITKPPA